MKTNGHPPPPRALRRGRRLGPSRLALIPGWCPHLVVLPLFFAVPPLFQVYPFQYPPANSSFTQSLCNPGPGSVPAVRFGGNKPIPAAPFPSPVWHLLRSPMGAYHLCIPPPSLKAMTSSTDFSAYFSTKKKEAFCFICRFSFRERLPPLAGNDLTVLLLLETLVWMAAGSSSGPRFGWILCMLSGLCPLSKSFLPCLA